MIKFTINGRSVDPNDLKDVMMASMLEGVRAHLSEKIGGIRDPNTGEFPTVVVRGDDISNLKIQVEGSPELMTLVGTRLGGDVMDEPTQSLATPRVFLSYTSDDIAAAKRIAEALEAAGIEVWWDKWCISPGDSLRRKIDEGIAGCTHFLVLLTPRSIKKPWVNQEMDAGLVRKLNDQCRFLPVRSELPVSELPPLLSGILSPSIATDEDIAQLISDIHGLTRRPSRGGPPSVLHPDKTAETGYSAAANAIARLFVEQSKNALFADPQFDVETLAQEVGLSVEDTEDALHELSGFFEISGRHVLVQGALFAQFDQFWKPWKPADDALRLAADIMSEPTFPADCASIATRYGWEARRLNPVAHYLLERRLIEDYRALGIMPWAVVRIVGNDSMRRFVKSRS